MNLNYVTRLGHLTFDRYLIYKEWKLSSLMAHEKINKLTSQIFTFSLQAIQAINQMQNCQLYRKYIVILI